MPFFALTMSQTAGSHLASGSGESSKMVPDFRLNWRRGCFLRHFQRRTVDSHDTRSGTALGTANTDPATGATP